MLRWALGFFAVAILAAVLGFGGVVVGALAGLAEILFYGFLALAIITLVANYSSQRGL